MLDARANTWHAVAGAARTFPELYPSRHLLPSGHIFYSRSGWAQADMAVIQTAYLPLTGALSGVWTSLAQQLFFDRQEGMAVMMIDDRSRRRSRRCSWSEAAPTARRPRGTRRASRRSTSHSSHPLRPGRERPT